MAAHIPFILAVAILPAATPSDVPNQPGAATLSESRALLGAGSNDQAREKLLTLLARDPHRMDARVLLARTYLNQDPLQARKLAVQILNTQPDNTDAIDVLTASYQRLRAAGLTRSQEAKVRGRELDDYQGLLRRLPDNVELLYRSASQRLAIERLIDPADRLARARQVSAAIAELERLAALSDHQSNAKARASAHYQLGRALKHQADAQRTGREPDSRTRPLYRRALDQFGASMLSDPNRVDALGEAVLVYRSLVEPAHALQAVKAQLAHITSSQAQAKAYTMLGHLYAETGDSAQAITAFRKTLALDRHFMDTYLGLFNVYRGQNQQQQASEVLREALGSEPNFVRAHLELGRLSVAAGDYPGAISEFRAALDVPVDRAVVLGMVPSQNVYRNRLYHDAAAWLAWLYLDHAKDPARALGSIALARRFGPADAHLLDTEGLAQYRLGHYSEARQALEKAAAMGKGFAALYYHLAQTYMALEHNDKARRALKRALAFKETFAERDEARALLARLTGGSSN